MFRLAKLSDCDSIIDFLREHWDSNHVYVRHPSLFRYDFVRDGRLTFGLFENKGCIEGIFGYFFYNNSQNPDIGGMLWCVSPDSQRATPMLGLRLRDFVLQTVPHRFFGAPGAGIQTKVIYEKIGSKWIKLDHFVGKISGQKWPKIVVLREGCLKPARSECKIQQINSFRDLLEIPDKVFTYQTPIKDFSYLAWRYLFHPYHYYNIWRLNFSSDPVVVVSRIQKFGEHKIMRVIDYLGPVAVAAPSVLTLFSALQKSQKLSYVDFVCSGFSKDKFEELGFITVNFEDQSSVVPNHFEPFVAKSVQIYANADRGFDNVVMVKGNGDQDRPNSDRNWFAD